MTTAPSRLPRLLSIPHVAEHLGVCTKTVRRLIDAGELIATRIGHRIRITTPDFRSKAPLKSVRTVLSLVLARLA